LLVIVLLILFGVLLGYAADKLFLEERIRNVSLSAKDEDILVLEREPLSRILNQSQTYEALRRTQEIHRSRSLPRPDHRKHHLAQAGNGGDGQGILPPGE